MAAGEGAREVARALLVGGDEGQVDGGFFGGRQLTLGAFAGFFEALEGHAVGAQVDAGFVFELLDQPVHDLLIEVFAAEVAVAGHAAHFEDAGVELEYRDVEGAAAEVVDGHDLVFAVFVEAVGEGGGGRLVDDAAHFEPGDAAGVFGGLPLRVVEVGGDGDDGVGDLFAQGVLGEVFDLGEDQRRDLLRAVLPIADLDADVAVGSAGEGIREDLARPLHLGIVEFTADQPLDREDGVLRVGDGLPFGDLADQAVVVLGESRRWKAWFGCLRG